jgi:hypothetical protein
MEKLGIFYGHLVYCTAIGNISWTFGIFYCNLVYFPRFGILDQEKSGSPVQESYSARDLFKNTEESTFFYLYPSTDFQYLAER